MWALAALGGAESSVPVITVAAVHNLRNRQGVFVATSDPNVFAERPGTLRQRIEDGFKMAARRVDTKLDEAIP
jgi:hypothetical protein